MKKEDIIAGGPVDWVRPAPIGSQNPSAALLLVSQTQDGNQIGVQYELTADQAVALLHQMAAVVYGEGTEILLPEQSNNQQSE